MTSKTAPYVRLVEESGRMILRIGPGDHSEQVWEISKSQLRSIVLDAMPILLGNPDEP